MYNIGFVMLIGFSIFFYMKLQPKTKPGTHQSLKRDLRNDIVTVAILGLFFFGIITADIDADLQLFGIYFEDSSAVVQVIKLILNPIFLGAMLGAGLFIHSALLKRKLHHEGLLTIPYHFFIEKINDSDSSDRWKLTYMYLDGFVGERMFSPDEIVSWEKRITLVTTSRPTPEVVAQYFLVQYLGDSPGDHALWKTRSLPYQSGKNNLSEMNEASREYAIISKILSSEYQPYRPVLNTKDAVRSDDYKSRTTPSPLSKEIRTERNRSNIFKYLFYATIAAQVIYLLLRLLKNVIER